MSERSNLISKLVSDIDTRASYIRAKLGTLVPAQIRALRLKSDMPRQSDLAREANMQQSRISMFETPGAANVTLETLSRLAAAFQVGLVVKFVPFSEMLKWENGFSQDGFNVTKIGEDKAFISPSVAAQAPTLRAMRGRWGMNVSAAHGQWAPVYIPQTSVAKQFEQIEPEIAASTEQGVNGTATVQTYFPFSALGLEQAQEREAV